MVDWRNVYISFRGLAFLIEEENKKFDPVSPEDKWKIQKKNNLFNSFQDFAREGYQHVAGNF